MFWGLFIYINILCYFARVKNICLLPSTAAPPCGVKGITLRYLLFLVSFAPSLYLPIMDKNRLPLASQSSSSHPSEQAHRTLNLPSTPDSVQSPGICRFMSEPISEGNRSVMLPDQHNCQYTSRRNAQAKMALHVQHIMGPFGPPLVDNHKCLLHGRA
jgi:hypothetical protein